MRLIKSAMIAFTVLVGVSAVANAQPRSFTGRPTKIWTPVAPLPAPPVARPGVVGLEIPEGSQTISSGRTTIKSPGPSGAETAYGVFNTLKPGFGLKTFKPTPQATRPVRR